MANILIVLTSHDTLGDTGKPTGFFMEELAAPYYALKDAGHDVTLASIAGGKPPVDPGSLEGDQPESVKRFNDDQDAQKQLAATKKITEVDAKDYNGVFLPGGHGVMWDFPDNGALAQTIGDIHAAGGVVGAVCHGPVGLVNVKRADGGYLVDGATVNGFTNAEEQAVELAELVPLMLESTLRARGAKFECGENFTPYAVRDGRLVTGQNPMSSVKTAQLMLDVLAETAPARKA